MRTAFDAFEASMRRVRELHALHGSIFELLTNAVDLSDILRSEVVMAVSAFDFFIHELVRLGMLECFSGKRPRTAAFNRWSLPIGAFEDLSDASSAEQRLDAEIRERHGFLSFQQPEKVADAIRLISEVKIWEEVSVILGESVQHAKDSFKLIIERRNKIAHEADLNPSYPGQLWPIDAAMVEMIFNRIESVARAIFDAVK